MTRTKQKPFKENDNNKNTLIAKRGKLKMLKTGTLTLYDENDNDLNIDLSVTQILTIVRILGIRQNNNDISSISCFGDLGLAEINEKY